MLARLAPQVCGHGKSLIPVFPDRGKKQATESPSGPRLGVTFSILPRKSSLAKARLVRLVLSRRGLTAETTRALQERDATALRKSPQQLMLPEIPTLPPPPPSPPPGQSRAPGPRCRMTSPARAARPRA